VAAAITLPDVGWAPIGDAVLEALIEPGLRRRC